MYYAARLESFSYMIDAYKTGRVRVVSPSLLTNSSGSDTVANCCRVIDWGALTKWPGSTYGSKMPTSIQEHGIILLRMQTQRGPKECGVVTTVSLK